MNAMFLFVAKKTEQITKLANSNSDRFHGANGHFYSEYHTTNKHVDTLCRIKREPLVFNCKFRKC
jgi:hypothetical protein